MDPEQTSCLSLLANPKSFSVRAKFMDAVRATDNDHPIVAMILQELLNYESYMKVVVTRLGDIQPHIGAPIGVCVGNTLNYRVIQLQTKNGSDVFVAEAKRAKHRNKWWERRRKEISMEIPRLHGDLVFFRCAHPLEWDAAKAEEELHNYLKAVYKEERGYKFSF